MNDLIFRDPNWLWFLLLLPITFLLRLRRGCPALVVPFAGQWHVSTPLALFRPSVVLAYLSLALMILALSRPQQILGRVQVERSGYDIVLVIDLSLSMLGEDMVRNGRQISRLEAVLPVVEAFISKRPHDRIGVVLFGNRAATLSPLTLDHAWLRRQVRRIEVGLVGGNTAMGDGLALALNRLKTHPDQEPNRRAGKFVILLSDGESNTGSDPLAVARIAAEQGVIIHTVGAGTDGLVPFPVRNAFGQRVYEYRQFPPDETTLREIAAMTQGTFHMADDAQAIENAFAAIDAQEKVPFEDRPLFRSQEWFALLAAPALAGWLLVGWFARSHHGGQR